MSKASRIVFLTCDTGKEWNTEFNGEHAEAVRYFLYKTFTDEDCETGKETSHKVIRVSSNPIKPASTSFWFESI